MPRTILVVDDELINREILENMLCKDYSVLTAASGAEALAVLRDKHSLISAVLLDLKMPNMDGFEALQAIRRNELFRPIPIIVVTALTDPETEEKAVSLGAYGFVTKPYKSVLIKHHLINAISFRETAMLQNIIRRDDLTGILSKRGFIEQAEALIKSREPGYYVLCCVDVDSFKIINDQYGVQMGDRVLKHIANTLSERFPAIGGICGRVFADDFIVMYPAADIDSEATSQCYREMTCPKCLNRPIRIRVGRYHIGDVTLPVSAMFDRAVMAKESIKGRYDVSVATYNDKLRADMLREQQVVSDMGAALAERQFEVWYQPQYNHSTGALIGAEALARWRHPQNGLIPPSEFIPIFERNGFIYSLDKFIWEQVCVNLRTWIDEGRNPLPVSVNISRQDIANADLVDTLTGLLARYAIPIALLRLEITESAFVESSDAVADVVMRLVKIGFTVEIDDFGSGYSSLNTLKDVPAQIIKLDMKFLQSGTDSGRGGSIIESIVRMVKWLGMSVIAEGVETLEQANYLRSIGCNYVQGYLYAKPMPKADYEAHCKGGDKEERLLVLETVENLDNNAFWDPESMDTLIFNSYVGGACIFEYRKGNIELLRATEKYIQVIGSAGMTVADALKLNWSEHLDEENGRRVIANMEESERERKEVTDEYVFLDLPNCPHETYLRTTLRVIASTGDRRLVYCTNENITAQRKAERHERAAAERLQAVMDNVNCGILAVVVDGEECRNIFINDRYYEIMGYTKAQFDAEVQSVFDLVHPDDRALVLAAAQRANEVGGVAEVVYRIVRRDGSIAWIKTTTSTRAFEGVQGSVQVGAFTDVTEERAAQQEIEAAAAQIRSMMHDMPGGFIRLLKCADGRLEPIYINDGMATLTGMSREELAETYRRDAFSEIHPDDVADIKAVVRKIYDNGRARCPHFRRMRGNGSYIWLAMSGRATRNDRGDTFLNLYYTDASEQVKQEETQRALLDNLPCGAGVYEFRDGHMSLTYQNKSYWELVGLYKADFPDPAPMSAVYPDDVPKIMQELSAAIQQNRDVSCDIRLRHLEEGYFPVRLAGRIVRHEAGGFLIYATFTPIRA